MLRELKYVVRLLERERLEYMIGGGIANSYWGYPRSTTDIDIVVPLFHDFEKDALERVEGDLKKRGWAIKAGVGRPLIAEKPTVRLDFWSIKSFYDKERFGRRIKIKLEDLEIWITTPEDLVLQKLLWYRGKDLEDIKGVLARQEKLDWNYLKKWAKNLDLEDKLNRAQKGEEG